MTKKTKPGFSFQEFFQRMGDNLVSRLMGFMVRACIVFAYLFLMIFFVISIPFLFLGQLVFLPLLYGIHMMQKTEDQIRNETHDAFIKNHLYDEINRPSVEKWFEKYYQEYHKGPWWLLKNLMSSPPIGRDLTSGFTPALDEFSTELTKTAPHYIHFIGRKKEMDQMQRLLAKSGEANVILIGEEGSGRGAMIEYLSQLVYEGTSNAFLAFKRILDLNMEKILAFSSDQIKREEKIGELLKEASESKNVILVIRNIDLYVSSDEKRINLTNIISKYAELPTLQIIGTTTPYNYQKYIFPNKPIAQIFETIEVSEIDAEQTFQILLVDALAFEKRHATYITFEAIRQAVVKADTYIKSSPFPQKALELLDEACIYAKTNIKSDVVSPEIINAIIQQKTKVPIEMTDSFRQKLVNLDTALKQRVVHQDEALDKLSAALRKSFVMDVKRNKPLASFLFLGPTGVGKTETAKAVTEVFFDNINNMMRFDMSQYQLKEDITKLIGSIETHEPGLLTETIRKQEYGTLLLDELEKASPDLLNIFLTVLDEGYFTDGFGKRVECKNLIVIATSNAGSDFIFTKLQDPKMTIETVSSQLIDYLVEKNIYSPEFLNRFDGVLVYKPLSKEAVTIIAQRVLAEIQNDTKIKYNIELVFTPEFVNMLITKGYDPRFGARNMKRIIQDDVEGKISKIILEKSVTQGQKIQF